VLSIPDAPNWAQMRFGLSENELDLRVLRGSLGCEHIGVSYMRFGPEAPSAIRVRSEQFRAIRAVGDDTAVFVVAGYPKEDPTETEFAADSGPKTTERR
jgi:hypothetical protein